MRPLEDVALARLDVHRLRSIFPDMEQDDPELWESMIESETTIHEAIAKLYNRKEDLICDVAALDMQIAQRKARKDRLLQSADALDKIMLRLIRESNVRRVDLPEVTLTIRAPSKSVDVYDPSALAGDYLRQKPAPPPEPDKVKIAEALRDNKPVPGARWQYGQETLQERTK